MSVHGKKEERKQAKQNIKSSGKIKLSINFIHYSFAPKHIFMLPQDLMRNDEERKGISKREK